VSLGTRQIATQTISYHIRQLPDLDQAYATCKLQVQSKSLYQNSRNQNSGEFKAEN
jgi:hypothetical protein